MGKNVNTERIEKKPDNMPNINYETDISVTSILMTEFSKFQDHLDEVLERYTNYGIRINALIQKYGDDYSRSSKVTLEDNGTPLISVICNGNGLDD